MNSSSIAGGCVPENVPDLDGLVPHPPTPTDGPWASQPGALSASSTTETWSGACLAAEDDSRLERVLRHQFEQLEPSESFELKGLGGFKVDLSGEFRGAVRAERKLDGTFLVQLGGQGELGVGAPVLGAARLGLAAATVFHLETAAQAADVCDALIKGAVVVAADQAVPGLGAALDLAHGAGMTGDLVDARARVLSYLPKISEVSADVTGYAQLGDELSVKAGGFNFKALSAKASIRPSEGLSVDFEKSELRLNTSVSFAGDAFLKVPLALNVSQNGKLTLTGTSVLKMPADVVSAVKEGRLSAEGAWAQLAVLGLPDELVLKAQFELADKTLSVGAGDFTVRVKGEVHLGLEPESQTLDPEKVRRVLREMKFDIESEGGLGLGTGFDLAAFKAEFSMLRKRKHQWGGSLSAGEAIKKATDLQDISSQSALSARRAMGSMH